SLDNGPSGSDDLQLSLSSPEHVALDADEELSAAGALAASMEEAIPNAESDSWNELIVPAPSQPETMAEGSPESVPGNVSGSEEIVDPLRQTVFLEDVVEAGELARMLESEDPVDGDSQDEPQASNKPSSKSKKKKKKRKQKKRENAAADSALQSEDEEQAISSDDSSLEG
ncbi:MAG: hypothetical protein N2C14_06270, partial [Planctomycetales bacterium]